MSKYIGSNFDEFFHEDGLIEEVSAGALKRRSIRDVCRSQRVHQNRFIWQSAIDGAFRKER